MKKVVKKSVPVIWAHRGARSLAPENTLAAARMAAEVGADGWEFDVRMTKDGELVLMHDTTLERTTNVKDLFPDRAPWKVSDFTIDEICKLDAGSWFVERDPFGTILSGELKLENVQRYRKERVPTLQEALLVSQELGLLVNIEIKAEISNFFLSVQDKAVVDKVIQTVRKFELTHKVLVSSFNPWIIGYLKEKAPEIRGAILVQTPVKDLTTWLERFKANGFNPRLDFYSPEQACKLRQKEFEIHVWTVNDPDDLFRLISDPCVCGIITDWPQRARRIIESHR